MYARASIVELLPDPLTPLFADLSTKAVTQATARIFTDLFEQDDAQGDWLQLTTINGYAYYAYQFTGQVLWMFTRGIPKMVRFFARNEGEKRWRQEFHPRYARIVEAWEAKPLSDLSATALLDGVQELLYSGAEYYTSVQMIIPMAASSEIIFTKFYNQFVKRAGDHEVGAKRHPPAQTFLLGFDSAPIRADKALYDLATWCRIQPQLAAALLDMPSNASSDWLNPDQPPSGRGGRPDEAVWHAWCSRFRDHLRQHGRMIYDLDFAKAVPADDPGALFDTLKYYLRGAGQNPHLRQAEAAARREEATKVMLTRLDPLRRAIFRRLLQWAQKNAPTREDALADEGLAWPVMRQMLFELGRRLVTHGALAEAGDVFWLEQAELQQAAAKLDANQAQIPSLAPVIQQRKAEWRARKLVTPPPLLPKGKKMWGIDLEPWMPVQVEEQHGDTIVGVGASAGEVTAVARVLHGPEDFSALQPGDVLVAGITTPAWTPLFALASAVVTDVGGPLSHSSIVAREYGIPAVLGTGAATRRIRSGQTIRVNGDAGTVTLLDGTDETAAIQPSPEAASTVRHLPRVRTVACLALAAGVVVAVAIWWKNRHNIRR
jgi:pyruvate,water dikinase